MADIADRKVAVLATHGFEEVELTEPVKALRDAGAEVTIVSLKKGSIQGMHHDEKGDSIPVDAELSEVDHAQFDALLLPGGVANPDTLRLSPEAIAFVRGFVDAKKPIAAICHGPWTLIDAGGVSGKRVTSWPSLKEDLVNAGAHWMDEAVVEDTGLVTSRNPGDIPKFNAAMIAMFAG